MVLGAIQASPSIGSICAVEELVAGHADLVRGRWCRAYGALVVRAAHAAQYLVGKEWYDKDLRRGVSRVSMTPQEVDDESDKAQLTVLYAAHDPSKLLQIDKILAKRPTKVDRDKMWSEVACIFRY